MEKLSQTMENYLEAIYELSSGGDGARVSDIANRLRVSKASTNNAVNRLSEKGFITNERYGEIYLTSMGREYAEVTATKHHVLHRFFTEALGIGPDTADADACAIEHVISNDTIRAMQGFLSRQKSRVPSK